jgi:putative flippase GtrA
MQHAPARLPGMSSLVVDRLRPIASELFKFVVVGGFCFVLDTLLAYLLRFEVGLGPTTSKALSTIIATAVSYVGNRLWSFAHRVDEERGHGQDISVYAFINVVGLVITLVPVDIAHYLLSATSPLAFTVSGVIGTAFATVFRFWAYRRYVFPSAPDMAERAALV